jgi:hypothetical protein
MVVTVRARGIDVRGYRPCRPRERLEPRCVCSRTERERSTIHERQHRRAPMGWHDQPLRHVRGRPFFKRPPLVSSENCATLAHPTLPCPRLSRCPVTSVLVTPATMITRGMQRGNLEGKHAGRRGSRAMGHGGDPRTRQPFIEVLCSSGLTGPSARSVCRRELHRNAERRAERRAKGSRA